MLEGTVIPMPKGKYQRVLTIEGDWKSICRICFLTAARDKREDSLERGELEHVCMSALGSHKFAA